MKNKLLIVSLASLLTIILLSGCVSRVTTDPQIGKSYIQSFTNTNENFLDRDISNLVELNYHKLGVIIQRIQVKDWSKLKMYFPSGYISEEERLDAYAVSNDDYKEGNIIYIKFFNGNKIVEEGYVIIKR